MSEQRMSCFGEMYLRGEKYMETHCLDCPLFNKCKEIGAGLGEETTIPREPDTWGELKVKW